MRLEELHLGLQVGPGLVIPVELLLFPPQKTPPQPGCRHGVRLQPPPMQPPGRHSLQLMAHLTQLNPSHGAHELFGVHCLEFGLLKVILLSKFDQQRPHIVLGARGIVRINETPERQQAGRDAALPLWVRPRFVAEGWTELVEAILDPATR